VYFDDKNENYLVYADYLVPTAYGGEVCQQSLEPRRLLADLRDGQGLYSQGGGEWYTTFWDIMRIKTNQSADRFNQDGECYYTEYLHNFRFGATRSGSASAFEHRCLSWED
jgi:hypothetical protein